MTTARSITSLSSFTLAMILLAGPCQGNSADQFSLAVGENVGATNHSFVFGLNNQAHNYSLAGGEGSTANTRSLAIGVYTVATDHSFSIGGNNASGYSGACGWGNTPSQASFAAGGANIANNYSVAFGYVTQAYSYAIAAGLDTYASAYGAAFGKESRAEAAGSIVAGLGTVAESMGCATFGLYNRRAAYYGTSYSYGGWVGSDPILIVGNGTSNTARSDALTVYKNGTVIIPKVQGDISMGEFGN